MTLKNTFKIALVGLRTNKSRSALTILGIVIGITAIIAMMSVGQEAQNLIVNQIRGLGSKTILISPGRQPKGPADVAQMLGDSLKEKDVVALKKKSNVPHLSEIMPVVVGTATAVYEDETYQLTILGASEFIA